MQVLLVLMVPNRAREQPPYCGKLCYTLAWWECQVIFPVASAEGTIRRLADV